MRWLNLHEGRARRPFTRLGSHSPSTTLGSSIQVVMCMHLGTWPDLGNQSAVKSTIQTLVFTLGRPLSWYPSAYKPKIRVACWGCGSVCPCTARVPDFYSSRWHSSGNSLLLLREYSIAARCSSSCCRSATIDHPAPSWRRSRVCSTAAGTTCSCRRSMAAGAWGHWVLGWRSWVVKGP